MRIVVVSAEPSGHRLAQRLLTVLDGEHLPVELAAVGPFETLSLVPRAITTLARLRARIHELAPDRVVTIDAPTLLLRLASDLTGQGIPVVHWVSPQIWAWRAYRRHRIASALTALGCLLPFEAALYRDTSLRARFTGHPAAAAPRSSRPQALGVAAGSRSAERARLGPVFAAAAQRVGLPVVEAVPPGRSPVVRGARVVSDVASLAQEVAVALVCSGTATLELAAAGVPMVAAYGMHPTSFALARSLVGLDTAALPNLVLGSRLVPELFQHEVQPRALERVAARLLGPDGDRMADALREVGPLSKADLAVQRFADLVVQPLPH